VRLASVRPGDIVRVDGSLAYVVEKPSRGRIAIRWALRTGIRTISARQVEAAWRQLSNGKAAP
jgi:hypothetical protein